MHPPIWLAWCSRCAGLLCALRGRGLSIQSLRVTPNLMQRLCRLSGGKAPFTASMEMLPSTEAVEVQGVPTSRRMLSAYTTWRSASSWNRASIVKMDDVAPRSMSHGDCRFLLIFREPIEVVDVYTYTNARRAFASTNIHEG
jgi:hypothetical protein